MGQPDTAGLDVASLLSVADQYQRVADILDGAVRTHLSGLTFDGATAGRDYVARGDAVRGGLEQVVRQVRQWSRACSEIAAVLRMSADRYVDADARAGERVG
ncbi:type VII secretion target [Mycolicibacterium pulveris]|uniref:type VII secretion target n=1 Tax=Mycolicibacterium pulveris TaxID=36813 RepID=UPI003CF37BE5